MTAFLVSPAIIVAFGSRALFYVARSIGIVGVHLVVADLRKRRTGILESHTTVTTIIAGRPPAATHGGHAMGHHPA